MHYTGTDMNICIKRLAEQALGSKIPYTTATIMAGSTLEEFARLIIRDCQILSVQQPTGLQARNAINSHFSDNTKPVISYHSGMWFCQLKSLIHGRIGAGSSPEIAYNFWKKYNER